MTHQNNSGRAERCKHGMPKGQCALCLTEESADVPFTKRDYGGQRESKMENIDNRPMKECRGPCGKEKFLDEFHKNPGSKDGHENTCKACRAEQQKDRYLKKKNLKPNPPEESADAEPSTMTAGKAMADKGARQMHKTKQNLTLYIEMEKYRDLMDRLIKVSKEQMRTPELQALFYIKIGLEGVLD